jgi:hypothetical protein
MWPMLLSFLWTAVSFIFRTVVIKFFIFSALFVLLTELLPIVLRLLNFSHFVAGMQGSMVHIPPSVWFFLNAFRFDVGVPLILTAYATRFIIRRLPVVG